MALRLSFTVDVATLADMERLTQALKPWLLDVGSTSHVGPSNGAGSTPVVMTVGQPPSGNGTADLCHIHQAAMQTMKTKDGSRTFTAHRLESGNFCYGKERKN